MTVIPFVLASASPARLRELRAAGLDPDVVVSGIDEDSIRASSVDALVGTLARIKAHAVAAGIRGDAVVLGCDSLLDIDGTGVGKPGSAGVARERWRLIRGRSAILRTGHALVHVVDGDVAANAAATAATTVHFADPSDEDVDAYIASAEPLEVAGAFTIDGFGGWFVERIEGDHHNVVGVSLPLVRRLLSELGLSLTDLGWPAQGG